MPFNTHYQMLVGREPNWLTFQATDGASVVLRTWDSNPGWNGTMYYSTDTLNWNIWDGSQITGPDGVIYVRGTSNTVITGTAGADHHWYFSLSDASLITCTGNIETLLDWETVAVGGHPPMDDYCFYYMFINAQKLLTAPRLPAMTLKICCYSYMFDQCIRLQASPDLPATELAANCYDSMFNNCTSLTVAGEISATTLALGCCAYMFWNCGITTAPALHATTLAQDCYRFMFGSCKDLVNAPELPATTLALGCYRYMFMSCNSLIKAPALPATNLASYCYTGMFDSCSNLEIIPRIPIRAGLLSAYAGMFDSCLKVNISESEGEWYYTGEASWLDNSNIFQGCNNGTFTTTVEGVNYYTTNTII